MWKRILGIGAALILVAALAGTWVLGPRLGTALTGAPFFLVPPSPQRYAAAALDAMQTQGLFGDSEGFRVARAESEREIEDAESTEQTWPALARAAEAAGGKHSAVVPPSGDDDEDPSPDTDWSPGVTRTALPGSSRFVATARVPGVDAERADGQGYADTLAHGLHEQAAAGACGVVVDLRGNSGGDMGPMVAGVSSLLPDGEVLWFDAPSGSHAVSVAGGAVSGGGSPVTVEQPAKLGLPTAVLVDERTASSGEATMLAFRGLPNSRSFGSPTAGYASANTVIRFPDGMRLLLTVARDRDRTGAVHLDEPVPPDVPTAGPEAEAHAWLTQRCGG